MSATQFALAVPALAVVLGIAMAIAWVVRRLGLNRPLMRSKHIILIDHIPIGTRRHVHLIQCDGHRLLFATGGGSDILLGTWPAPPETLT